MNGFRVWGAFLALVAAGSLVAGCAGSGGQPSDDTDPAPSDETRDDAGMPVIEVDTSWDTGKAADITTLVSSADVIFAGEVTGLRGQRFRNFSLPQNPSGPPYSTSPEGGSGTFPISLFEVRVERNFSGSLAEGSIAVLQQAGGVTKRPDGSNVRMVLEGDRPLAIGERYLFFANSTADDTLSAPPYARLQIGAAGELSPLPGWGSLGAMKRLSAKNIEEARFEIDSVAPR